MSSFLFDELCSLLDVFVFMLPFAIVARICCCTTIRRGSPISNFFKVFWILAASIFLGKLVELAYWKCGEKTSAGRSMVLDITLQIIISYLDRDLDFCQSAHRASMESRGISSDYEKADVLDTIFMLSGVISMNWIVASMVAGCFKKEKTRQIYSPNDVESATGVNNEISL
ncbi:unnamed protein product [Bursaphelenchus xylophilus]|uniref:(pine wood nematode) hypothetical protein n=1 Tax=Bursaphelenchus xylophilus TaxID=6326 RepID=A0A1I7SRM2_BURXY|nr:unnamed protein product [Bursaphelenchus xylophilus]CAG9102163.1 unnamed protein product [Bursaphelenchus xylophilus]